MGNHGDRLTSPLRRRPDGGHEPVDWDTALTEIAARLHAIRDAEARGQRHQERPNRKMIVIDPRRTETAEAADLHLALHPNTDAYLLAAILALIVRRGGQDDEFLAAHTDGFAEVAAALDAVPADEWIRHAEVDRADVERAVDLVLAARAMTVRVELGIQQGRHSTLNSYLEKLLYLVTGNFGRRGTNNLHSWLMPLWGNSNGQRSEITGFSYIGGLLPANTLAEEVLTDHPHRIRVLWVESSNPANTYADTAAVERAIRARELSVVVEVACAMAPLWVGCHRATATMTVAVQRALGSEASGAALGEELFERITTSPSGTAFSTHTYDEVWDLVRRDRIQLGIPELLDWLAALDPPAEAPDPAYPFSLVNGQRRSHKRTRSCATRRGVAPTRTGRRGPARPIWPPSGWTRATGWR